MLSGLQLLDGVDEQLHRTEGEVSAAQGEVDRLSTRRDLAREAEVGALRALARIRLGVLREGKADLQRLDEADAKAQALLAEQRKAIDGINAGLTTAEPALEAAKAEREKYAAQLRAADADGERSLASARDIVLADPAWQTKREAAEAAERVAGHAEQKAAFARQDSEVKGAPYLADPLFAYLLRRHYGTPQYRAGLFARMIDGWVAKVARFAPALRNYTLLTELPKRLSEHAARMREAAQAAAAEVLDHARQIAGLPSMEAVARLRQSMSEADTRLEAAQAKLDEIKARRAAIIAGEDPTIRDAIAGLEAALGQTSLQDLRAAAARTPTQEDDAIVARLEQARAARLEAEKLLGQRTASLQAARRQAAEVRQVRQEMRQRGYDQGRWNFGGGAMVGLLLGELLRGSLSRGSFWDQLDQQRLPDPWSRGGGPSVLRQPPLHDPWGQPGGSFGGGGFGGGSFGGGSFGTGGSVGGGDFKTGGSF